MSGDRGPRRRHDVATTRAWVAEGTRLLTGTVADLPDEAFRAPSLLPGWSRAHVVAHVARNAEALVRLSTWARTGTETPMYASAQARDAEIEQTAAEPPPELRHALTAGAAELEQAFDAMDEQSWGETVRATSGRTFRASALPWMRAREVWLHTVDLDTAVGLERAPVELVDELLTDVSGTVGGADGCPPVALRPTDRPTAWHLGPGGPDGPDGRSLPAVTGPAVDLVLWLTGRSDGRTLQVTGGSLPSLPRWL